MSIRKNVRMTLCATILVVLSWGATDSASAEQDLSRVTVGDRHQPAGSWLVTYDVPAFGASFPLLLSLANEGVVIETDAPGKFELSPGFPVILTNGHGAWGPTGGREAFTFLYRKLIYQEDGGTAFGTTRTRARGSMSRDGLTFTATLLIEIEDLTGQLLFAAEGTASGSRIRVE